MPKTATARVAVLELTTAGVHERLSAIGTMPDSAVQRSRFLQLLQHIDAAAGLELDNDTVAALERVKDRLRL